MSYPLRVTVIQVSYGDDESVAERVERVSGLVRDVVGANPVEHPRLVVLPELWAPTGFDYQQWEERAEPLNGPTGTAMSALAAELGILLHAGSIVERLEEPGEEGKSLSNTSLLFGADGSLIARYRKIHRFGFGSGEPKLMEAGGEISLVELPSGHRVALSTCYDLRFPELYRRQLDGGADLFVIPAAWPAARVAAWTLLGQARAVENQCFVVQCNTAGTHAGVEMGGHSQVVAPSGEVLAEAGGGSAGEGDGEVLGDAAGGARDRDLVLDLDIDLDDVAAAREKFPVLADRRL